jgi:hypothetical protein
MHPNVPGFSADRAVRPAQQAGPCASRGSAACRQCWSDCIAGCEPNVSECFPGCRLECGGQPRDPGPVGGAGGGPAPPLLSYGNYCGPGFGDPTGVTPPVDAVDAVCRRHDLCYGATTPFNCGCDRALITSMPAAIAATPSLVGRAAGAVAMSYFAGAPCTCPLCLPPFGPCFPVPAGVGGAGPC